MKLWQLAPLLVTVCLASPASPARVVRVGRNGRHTLHHAGEGTRLGRKVRRRGRNTLVQPALAPLPAAVPTVSAHPGHTHVLHDTHHAIPAFHAAPESFAHHHVPHAPSNLFHFAHHSAAIDPNLHHPSLHHAVPLHPSQHHAVHAVPLHAPVQVAAPVQHFSFNPAPPTHHFVQPAFVQPAAPLPLAPEAPAVIAVGRSVAPAPAPALATALAPAPVEVVRVAPTTLYGAPVEAAPSVEAARQAPDSYLPAVAPSDSYIPAVAIPAPIPEVEVVRVAPATFYGAPVEAAPAPVEVVRVAPATFYGAPVEAAPAPVEVVRVAPATFYGAPVEAAPAPVEVVRVAPATFYGAPVEAAPAPVEVVRVAPAALYGAPVEAAPSVEAARQAPDSYLPAVAPSDSYIPAVAIPAPIPVAIPAPAPTPDNFVVLEVARDAAAAPVLPPRASYLAAAPSAPIAVVKSNVLAATRAEPIAIVRSVLNAPDTLHAATNGWDYSYEAANGIKQEATGSLRLVDDTQVSVMRGSYEFVGADNNVYAVEWFADETGFHATAPHLPRNVEPNHPEVAAAVRAQIAFAASEDQAAVSGVLAARAPHQYY